MQSSPATAGADRAATALSLACIVHCLLLPIIAISLPFLAAVAEAEIVHQVLATLAIVLSASVPLRAHNARSIGFLVPAALGCVCLLVGLGSETIGISETPPTVLGGLFLAFAHVRRLAIHQ